MFFFQINSSFVHNEKITEREGTHDTSHIGCRIVMVEHKVFISDFDWNLWDGNILEFVLITQDWINICQFMGCIYPSMVREFYLYMSSMHQNASSHNVTVLDVQFEVSIAQLLKLPRISEASTTLDVVAMSPSDVGKAALSTNPSRGSSLPY